MLWTEQLIHFVDFEGSTGSGILEFGVVSLRAGRIVATRGRKCRPSGRVRPEEVAVHGLDPEALGHEAPFANEFAAFAELRASGPLAAHFATAENTLLKAVWPYGREAVDFSRPSAALTAEWGPWIDTGRLFPQARAAGWPVRLGELIAAEGLQTQLDELASALCPPDRRHYHAALYDALAGAVLLLQLGRSAGWGDKSLRWLFEQSTLDPEERSDRRQETLFPELD
ncbi:MAG: 3'-5' exonuclease [Verrucomicrobia bacterium]|nr:MAG: 3'-5' exonuclease [Verrucomicrobiota bacterium]